jgi:hypothetical protein
MANPPKRKVNAVLGRTLLNVRRIYGNNTGCGFYDLTVGQVLRTKVRQLGNAFRVGAH